MKRGRRRFKQEAKQSSNQGEKAKKLGWFVIDGVLRKEEDQRVQCTRQPAPTCGGT